MHGRGLGDDGPLVSPRSPGDRVRDVRLERNTAWVWKPTVWSADGQGQLVWGGDVLVTEQGGERLFARPHRLVSVS